MTGKLIRRITRAATLSVCVGLAASAVGCAGQGKHTTDAKAAARQRMDAIKAATQLDMARQSFLAGELKKALKSADQSIELAPSVARSHVLRGRILLEMDKPEQASEAFQTALTIDSENFESNYFLGVISERFAKPAEAFTYFELAAEQDPTNPQYTIAAAESLIDQGKLAESEKFLRERQGNFEHNAVIRQTLGHTVALQGRSAEAADFFEEANLLAPQDLSILEDLAQTQVDLGRLGEAEASLRKLLLAEEMFGRRDLKILQARCLLSTDRPAEARTLLTALTSDDEGASDVQAWIQLGNVSYVLGDMNQLRTASRRVAALAPQQPEGYVLRSLWQRDDGQLKEALDSLDLAVERRGSDIGPLVLKGILLEQMGRLQDAQNTFSQALSEDPANETVAQLFQALGGQFENSTFANVDDDGQ